MCPLLRTSSQINEARFSYTWFSIFQSVMGRGVVAPRIGPGNPGDKGVHSSWDTLSFDLARKAVSQERKSISKNLRKNNRSNEIFQKRLHTREVNYEFDRYFNGKPKQNWTPFDFTCFLTNYKLLYCKLSLYTTSMTSSYLL